MQLEDLPTKISQRILKSVTWTGVDAELPGHVLRRHLIVHLSRIGGGVSILRAAVARLVH